MKSCIAVTTPFLALLLVGHCSGPVEGKNARASISEGGSYVMEADGDYDKIPGKIYHESSGKLAFTITGQPKSLGFQVTDNKQRSVFHIDDAHITCNEPFSYSLPSEQLTFTSHAPPKAPGDKIPNARAWRIMYRGAVFNYVATGDDHDVLITGKYGVRDTTITSSFGDTSPPWKVHEFGVTTILIHFNPLPDGKLPLKYTIGLFALHQQHVQKCDN